MRIIKRVRLQNYGLGLVVIFLPFFSMGEQISEKDEQIIRDFARKVIYVEVEKIKCIGDYKKDELSNHLFPQRFGLNYKIYEIYPEGGDGSIFYEFIVSETMGKVFSYTLYDKYNRRGDIKHEKPSKNTWLTKEEAIKSLELFFRYLEINIEKELSSPTIKEYHDIFEDFFVINQDAMLEGVLCRYRGISARVSMSYKRVVSFSYSPAVFPKNRKPEGVCPVEKVKEIAEEWLKTQERLCANKNHLPYLIEGETIQLVIAPGVNLLEIPGVHWIHKQFYYAWEVPIMYWEPYFGAVITEMPGPPSDRSKEFKGAVWVEVENLEVVGAK